MTQPDEHTIDDPTPAEAAALGRLRDAGGWVYWVGHHQGDWQVGTMTGGRFEAAAGRTRQEALLRSVDGLLRPPVPA